MLGSPIAALLLAARAQAHHPGERLDEVMAEKEPAFEPTDRRQLPDADLRTASGEPLDLVGLADQIVVLSLVPEDCGTPCEDQQALLAEVQESLSVTPMRDMVTFVTVASTRFDASSWNPDNWIQGAPDEGETVAELAASFAGLSARSETAPMVHLIDRGNRHAGIFHEADFGRINMVLYINGLTNAPPPPEPGLLERVFGMFL